MQSIRHWWFEMGRRTEVRRETAGIATVTLNCQAHCTSIPTRATHAIDAPRSCPGPYARANCRACVVRAGVSGRGAGERGRTCV
ncbi:MAG: hypothetical protein HYZ20_14830 [Burkholderiales bacterium]|nr:hypothetical protein [Burkholderiales bacterium]